MPIVLAPGETKTVRADLDNVMNGWRYFANAYYYSDGNQVKIKGTSFHTIIFPEIKYGDVNKDNNINITDVTVLINYLLTDTSLAPEEADMNQNGEINISDVTALINYLLTNE